MSLKSYDDWYTRMFVAQCWHYTHESLNDILYKFASIFIHADYDKYTCNITFVYNDYVHIHASHKKKPDV